MPVYLLLPRPQQKQSLFSKTHDKMLRNSLFLCLLKTCANINNDGCCVNVLFFSFFSVLFFCSPSRIMKKKSSLFQNCWSYLERKNNKIEFLRCGHIKRAENIYLMKFSMWILFLFLLVKKFIKEMLGVCVCVFFVHRMIKIRYWFLWLQNSIFFSK